MQNKLVKDYKKNCIEIAVNYHEFLNTLGKVEFHKLGDSINKLLRNLHHSIHCYDKKIQMPIIKFAEIEGAFGRFYPTINIIELKNDLNQEQYKITLLHEIIHYVQKNISYFGYSDDLKKQYHDRLEEQEAFYISETICKCFNIM